MLSLREGILVVAFALSACRSKELASDARIQTSGGHSTLAIEGASLELPDGEVRAGEAPPVTRDEAGRRLAYRTNGGARVLYRIGQGIFLGPIVAAPVDFAAAPEATRAFAPLWEMAKTRERRLALAAEVERERGAAGVVELLVATAPIPGAGWDELRARVPSDKALKDAFEKVFADGDGVALSRAAHIIDLGSSDKKKLIAAKAGDLAKRWREPRTAAVLLRTVLAGDPKSAGPIACDALRSRPKTEAPDDAFFAEAANLVLAATDAECAEDTAKLLEPTLTATLDHPSFRCNEGGPLGWRTTTKQDEPLCTKEQLAPVVAAEAKRPPVEAFTAAEARPELLAYAGLLARGRLPPAFVAAHERRRYAIVQKGPSCEDPIAAKTPCVCDEATLRQNAALHAPGHVTVGVCELDVDAQQKRISNVVRFVP